MNRHVTNRLLGPLAPWLPAFGVVLHVGRRSGRQHRTPVNVFRAPRGYVLALTYGSDAEWVKNVLAAGGCELMTRGKRERLVGPRLFRDQNGSAMPGLVRVVLRLARVDEYLELSRVPDTEGRTVA